MSKDNQGIITISDLEQHGRWVFVCETEFPVFEKVDTVSFSIKNVECRMIRQKTAKTITVYEQIKLTYLLKYGIIIL